MLCCTPVWKTTFKTPHLRVGWRIDKVEDYPRQLSELLQNIPLPQNASYMFMSSRSTVSCFPRLYGACICSAMIAASWDFTALMDNRKERERESWRDRERESTAPTGRKIFTWLQPAGMPYGSTWFVIGGEGMKLVLWMFVSGTILAIDVATWKYWHLN